VSCEQDRRFEFACTHLVVVVAADAGSSSRFRPVFTARVQPDPLPPLRCSLVVRPWLIRGALVALLAFEDDIEVVAELDRGGQPNATDCPHRQPSSARSAPMVVSSPWPVFTTVSSGTR
jgi:hypothetical protein